MTKYRLLRGVHQGPGPNKEDGSKTSITYVASDPSCNIVESDVDLELKFGSEKFQNLDRMTGAVGDDSAKRRIAELEAENARLRAAVREADDVLDEVDEDEDGELDYQKMTLPQLRKLAKSEGIELEPGLGKEEIINVMKSELEVR